MAASTGSPFPVARSFHNLVVDGRDVQLRIFTPRGYKGPAKPAVVMVCGLLWFGGGFLGRIGLTFNDVFGKVFARNGVACVQIHTPSRHLAHTRFMDLLAVLTWPLSVVPHLRTVLLVGDVFMLANSPIDLSLLLLVPVLLNYFKSLTLAGLFALPLLHFAIRTLQKLRGGTPWPKHINIVHEVTAAVQWAQSNQEMMGSNGKLVLCGYSSGAHCAALYRLSADVPAFTAVVLISGIYSLRTHAWTGKRRIFAPIFNMIYLDILGCGTDEERDAASPEVLVKNKMQGDWYVLSARNELLGIPVQNLLFDRAGLCADLEAQGANVHQVTCGSNHWALVLSIETFIKPFCDNLT